MTDIQFAHKNRLTADGKMSFAPRSADPVAHQINALIDLALERETAEQQPRGYLGGSRIGLECARQLAYEYFEAREKRAAFLAAPLDWPQAAGRWPQHFQGKTIRRFRLGHLHEDETARWLRLAGFRLTTHVNGKQIGFAVATDPANGEARMAGNMDGRIESGPVALPYPLLWEHKIMKADKWGKTLEEGVAKVHRVYYYQMQIYMAYMELRNALFTALNTDTSELLFEVVPFVQADAQWASDRGVKVMEAKRPEDMPRVTGDPSDFRCKWCPFKDRCWSAREVAASAIQRPAWLGGK